MKDLIAARICLYTSLQAKGVGPLRSPSNYSGSGVDRKPLACEDDLYNTATERERQPQA